LFGGTHSIGRTLNLDGRDDRVIGAVDHWNPQPRFYDADNGFSFGEFPNYYLPFWRALNGLLVTRFEMQRLPGHISRRLR